MANDYVNKDFMFILIDDTKADVLMKFLSLIILSSLINLNNGE